MAQYFEIHPVNPQLRLIHRSVEILNAGGIIVYPTDSTYALGCMLDNKSGVERMRRIRNVDDEHNFTLVCRDLSDVGLYAKLDNQTYRTLKTHSPGPYTFIVPSSRSVPRRLQHPRRRTIGLRVPACIITQTLLAELGEPIISSTLQLPQADSPLCDPLEIREQLEHDVDLVIDAGPGDVELTTVIKLTDGVEVLRAGKGDPTPFLH